MNQYFPKWMWGALLVAAVLWALIKLQGFLVLLGVSYVLSYLLEPLVHGLVCRKVPRPAATFLVLAIFVALVFGVVATVLPQLLAQAQQLSEELPQALAYLEDKAINLYSAAGAYLPQGFSVKEKVTSAVANAGFVSNLGMAIQKVILAGIGVSGSVATLLLVPLFVFYISASFPEVNRGVAHIVPSERRGAFVALVHEIDSIMSKFVRGQLTVCVILSILYSAGFWIIGLKLSLVIGVVAGFATIIPYAGFPTGAVLSVLLSLVQYGTLSMVIQSVVVCLIVQVLESFLVTPKIVGSSVGISPLVVLIALTVGGTLFGILGMILAVPGAAISNVIIRKLAR